MDLVQVYSHPRSGTHLLAEVLKRNFYSHMCTDTYPLVRSHWARPHKRCYEPCGKLIGGHAYWGKTLGDSFDRCFYVYRDGRDVAVSLWRSSGFHHPERKSDSFSEFLRRPLDWHSSPGAGRDCYFRGFVKQCRFWLIGGRNPGFRFRGSRNIVEHWRDHLVSWGVPTIRGRRPQVTYVRYESLVLYPVETIRDIASVLGIEIEQPQLVRKRVGPEPHEGMVGQWRNVFSGDDLGFFFKHVNPAWEGLWQT